LISNLRPTAAPIRLRASSTSGLRVRFFVNYGTASLRQIQNGRILYGPLGRSFELVASFEELQPLGLAALEAVDEAKQGCSLFAWKRLLTGYNSALTVS
jgi:hypothetical protein